MSDTEALWHAHNELLEKHHALEARMAAHDARYENIVEKLDLSRRERTEQHEKILGAIGELKNEMAEKRGAAKFGMWVVGILLSLGVPPALFFWYTHGGGK